MPTKLLPYLSQAAKAAREHHDPRPSQQQVATRARIATTTLQRFENGPLSWPDRTDEVVESYAHFTDRAPLDIWRDALGRWSSGQRNPTARDASPSGPSLVGPVPDPTMSPNPERRARTRRTTG
jgi:hypothetical protein